MKKANSRLSLAQKPLNQLDLNLARLITITLMAASQCMACQMSNKHTGRNRREQRRARDPRFWTWRGTQCNVPPIFHCQQILRLLPAVAAFTTVISPCRFGIRN